MAFVSNDYTAKVYAPGYFLADNENYEVKTRQANSSDARVETTDKGGKYLPAGTIFPTNDAYATGIIFEDVDVTFGDMPCAVVLKGTVYEDRLPITGAQYDAVTVGDYVSPKDEGWYERSGSDPDYTYTLSTDTTANGAKTYYAKTGDDTYSAVTVGNFVSPRDEGWYESDGGTGYVPSTDTTAGAKTYYAKTDIRMSSAAKSALEALGFKFVTEPTVTRP